MLDHDGPAESERLEMAKTLHLDVVTPERQVLAQETDEVVLPGAEGSFGVLPGHMPMVVVLKPGLMKLKTGGEEKLYALGGGYAEIMPGKVIVLADTAEPAEDIDVEKARQEQDRSLAQLK